MEKLTIQIFTDPMMGLSYESEPVFRTLETHYPGMLEFRYRMGLLVRDVMDFIDPADLRFGKAEAIKRYNKRLARIYEEEEPIGGLPINMEGFHLFSETETSSLPMNLAYKAVERIAPEKAGQFLYQFRYATIVETRPTVRMDEILRVVRLLDIPVDIFENAFHAVETMKALSEDIMEHGALNVYTLPTYVLEYAGHRMVIPRLIGYDDFSNAIEEITNGSLRPVVPNVTRDAVLDLCKKHPLISPVEIRDAFEFNSVEDVLDFIQPLIKEGTLAIREVRRGWFIESRQG